MLMYQCVHSAFFTTSRLVLLNLSQCYFLLVRNEKRTKREHDLLQKEIAQKIGIDESRISDILRGKIESFAIDRLATYASKLYDRVRLRVSAA